MNPPLLPENLLKCISPADRKQLGKGGLTAQECQDRFASRTERAEAKLFAQWLTGRELLFIQARADRKSTIRVGWPDFTILGDGRTLLLEMKCPHVQPTKEQIRCVNALRSAGFCCEICRSAASAIETTKRFFSLV
jgi:hypothetical protein